MNKNSLAFLKLINYSIYNSEDEVYSVFSRGELKGVNWTVIFNMAAANSLLPVLYDVIVKASKIEKINESVLRCWKEEAFSMTVRQYRMYYCLRKILAEAEKEDITIITFKGCILADLYPQYALRSSSDSDIFIYKKDRKKVVSLLEKMGYGLVEEHSKPEVPVYFHPGYGHTVELHYYLWEDYEGSQIDILASYRLDNKEALQQMEVCGGLKVTTLGYEEHLIYQVFHIIKHFAVQGVGIRYVIDVSLYVNKYKDKIDWKRFWLKMSHLGYEIFCVHLFSIGIHYFGMDSEVLYAREIITPEQLEELIGDLINVGQIIEPKKAGWQILGIMTPYLVGEETVAQSKLMRKLKIIFPSHNALPEEYAYAKKYKLLLPVAWIHKGFNFFKKRCKAKDEWYNASEKLTIVEHRLSLMNKLGLIEKKRNKKISNEKGL